MLGAGDTAVPNKVGSFPHGAISSWEKETHSEGIKELVKVKVSQWRPTLCNPMNCSPLGSSVHGILQGRILEWVAIPFSRESFWPRGQTQVSHIAGRFFTVWATRKVYDKEASLDPSHFCVHFAAGRYQIFLREKFLELKSPKYYNTEKVHPCLIFSER